jgi:hypothetical protein
MISEENCHLGARSGISGDSSVSRQIVVVLRYRSAIIPQKFPPCLDEIGRKAAREE